MVRTRTRLLLRVLNKHQATMAAMELAEARQYFDKISVVRRAPRIARITEQYIGPEKKLRLRIYHGSAASQPTIVYFHGGGWTMGSLASHDIVARLLCRYTKSSVVSVDYRLAPEHPYPAAIQDGITTLRWLSRQRQGLNTTAYLAGDSAGGQVALYAFLQAPKTVQANVRKILLMYPALDPSLSTGSMERYAERHFVTRQNMRDFWRFYLGKSKLTWPLPAAQLASLPPVLVQVADYDILKDEGRDFAAAVAAAGGHSEYHHYPQTTHGLMQMPSLLNKRGMALRDILHFLAHSPEW